METNVNKLVKPLSQKVILRSVVLRKLLEKLKAENQTLDKAVRLQENHHQVKRRIIKRVVVSNLNKKEMKSPR